MEQATAAPLEMQRLGVVMEPDPSVSEEAEGVLNPATARGSDGELYLFPRVVAKGNYSRIGIARVLFNDAGDPAGVERLGYVLEPTEPYELRPNGTGGCEDPRITWVEPLGMYVMAYVAWGPGGPRVALSVSKDLFTWQRLGPVDFVGSRDLSYGVDFDVYHNKDAAFFPRAVVGPDGRESLCLLHRPVYHEDDVPHGVDDARPSMWLSYCALEDAKRDIMELTRAFGHTVLIDPEYAWEDMHIGGGTQPLLTPLGWLLVYHGVEGEIPTDGRPKNVRYTAGALLLDERDPRRVLYRTPDPILEPGIGEEVEGMVNNVVFPTGADDRGQGRIDIYYGMADSRIGAARLQLPESLPG